MFNHKPLSQTHWRAIKADIKSKAAKRDATEALVDDVDRTLSLEQLRGFNQHAKHNSNEPSSEESKDRNHVKVYR